MVIVNQFMNNKKQELREPELNRAKTDKELDEIHLGSMHIPIIIITIDACYYYYLEIIIDTDTLAYQKMYKNTIQSRPNSPSAQTWYHSSPLPATPKDGTVSSLPKKNYQATSFFLT